MNSLVTGARINYGAHHGTVRYIGELINSSSTWLGIEWDDPQRGKHDGSKDGVRYFHCQVPGAGSFVRPSAKLSLGRSFLDALSSKYVEALHRPGFQETVILGSSNGAIEVEAVDLNKVREKLADLGRLRVVSLDKENVSRSDPPGAVLRTCPNIRGLDLSNSLIPSWDVVAQIASELPNLERIALNRTRLAMPATDVVRFQNAFSSLVELLLNHTIMSWSDMMTITSTMPHLQTVEMAYNQLSQLHTTNELARKSTIQIVNLDGNLCNDWTHICDCLGMYSSLQRVVLTSNALELIPFPTVSRGRVGIKHLALSSNKLRSWNAIDALALWCPNLETLNLAGNPLTNEKNFRPIAVARIPSLKALDGSPISQKDRDDCELFYLSHIAHDASKEPDQLAREHPRWEQLRLKHGMEINRNERTAPGKLRDHMIKLNIYSAALAERKLSDCITLLVLPSMTLRALRAKISKAFKGRAARTKVMLWQRMQDGFLSELNAGQDSKDLSWLGLEDGSTIVYTLADE